MIEKLQFIHLYSFLCYFLLFAVLEYFFPLRKKVGNLKKRWTVNFGLSIINTLFARLILLITPVSVAFYMQNTGFGLFNLFQSNLIFEIVISVIILDFLIYFQHVFSHKWRWFWRLHSIHHSDTDIDVSTAIRFHILEIVISLFIKIFFVILLGLDPLSIVIFEIILVNSAIFSHSNLKLPIIFDKILSYIIVTQEFHQVHHSVKQKETDSNYGFFLSIWDKMFGTYISHNFRVEKNGLNTTKNNLEFREILLLNIHKK